MAPSSAKIVISASRRTDIPAFYMPWFMAQVERGFFEVPNPYNRRISVVPVSPDTVHSIVFWSKDYGPFINGGYGWQLARMGYGLYFHFSINSRSKLLEPRVPPLDRRLDQLAALCETFDPRAVNWRFDPICVYRDAGGALRDNLHDFDVIARAAARCGVRCCTTSFMDDYAKIRRRLRALPGMAFVDVPLERKAAIVQDLQGRLSARGIRLSTCCEKALMAALPDDSGIAAGACIPAEHLMAIYGGRLSVRRDRGQRAAAGCRCRVSVDIGAYRLHPCYHNCLFCYANPAADTAGGPLRPSLRATRQETKSL